MATTKTVPVTKLKRLGSQAPTFTLPVDIAKLNGRNHRVVFQCKALRKSEWAKLRDDHQRATMEAVLGGEPAATEVPGDAPDDGVDGEAQVQQESQSPLADALDNILKRGHEANVREGLERDAAVVMAFATGWDLEDDFNADNLQAMEDEFGGSLGAVLMAYNVAIYQGRLGN